MYAYALLVSVVLTGQLRAADERYNGQPATGNNTAAAPAGNANGSGLLPLGNPAAPANGGASGSATPAAPGGSSNPFRNPGSAPATPPRAFAPVDSGSGAPASAPSAAYQAPPNSSAADVMQPAGGLKPSAMMRAILSPPNGSQLRGQPLTLMETIAGAKSRAEQTQRVDAYWDMCSSVADYFLGLRELDELQRYVQRNGQWELVNTDMRNRTSTSLRAALASQLRLASLIGRGSDYLPLPADAPHCASYKTHFDQIFVQGAPPEAMELAALIPLRYTELQNATADVTKSEQYLETFRAGGDGLPALKLLALHRRAFVQIARDYNRRIARYSELASPGQVTAERLTGMLIKSTVASTATRPGAAAPPVNRQSSAAPPRTFAEGAAAGASPISNTEKQGDGVQAASGTQPAPATESTSHKERSLLVPSR